MLKSRRVELNAVAGLRFWATFLMVSGRAVESLWLDRSEESEWLSIYTCSALRRTADDLVSFYFILGGFQITWGYLTRWGLCTTSRSDVCLTWMFKLRDFDSESVRIRYWIGRLQRFYPDYFISFMTTIFLMVLGAGCWSMGLFDWIFNIGQLLLIGGLFAWIPWPTNGNVNGPVWFLVTLVWLWFFFPWMINPMKGWFRSESREIFIAKIFLLWIVSLVPWIVLIVLYPYSSFLGYLSYENMMWAFKPFPFFRMPEFLIGIALAIRVSDSRDYYELKSQTNDESEKRGFWPLTISLLGIGAIALFIIVSTVMWDPRCGGCLDVSKLCYGWLQIVDTRFVPLSALIIYSTSSLDVAAAASSEEDQASVKFYAGDLGAIVWRVLRWAPFQEINRWGLQLFLYQMPVQMLWTVILMSVRLGPRDHCTPQQLSPIFSNFFVTSQILLTYFIAWLMHDRGPVGKHVHGVAQELAKSAIEYLDQRSAGSGAPEVRLI